MSAHGLTRQGPGDKMLPAEAKSPGDLVPRDQGAFPPAPGNEHGPWKGGFQGCLRIG